MQILPEFLAQGTHFACGTGRAVFPEREVHGLADMYEHRDANVTLSDVVRKVRRGSQPSHACAGLISAAFRPRPWPPLSH